MKIGLVLEGGGLRASYTIGVLDCMMDKGIDVDYCIGVSAGACHGVSYVSRQRGRSRKVNADYVNDPRYLSMRNLIRKGSLFGMDFIFDEIPHKLIPFDYDTFYENPCEFVTVLTDIDKGVPAYLDKSYIYRGSPILQASSSLPLVSVPVEFEGGVYLDGGISDPIPVMQAMNDGCDKVVVVLTRDRDYIKSQEGMGAAYRHAYRKYPKLPEAVANRHIRYRQSQLDLEELEEQGKAFVIAPVQPLKVGRFETNPQKLDALFNEGYLQTLDILEELRGFIEKHDKQ